MCEAELDSASFNMLFVMSLTYCTACWLTTGHEWDSALDHETHRLSHGS